MLRPLSGSRKIKPFAVYDLETTVDLQNVYLVGWYDGKVYKYWESKPLPPSHPKSCVTAFLKWIFERPSKLSHYAHNGGNFDAVFLLSSIIANFPALKAEIIPSQSSILMLKAKSGGNEWTFLDSARSLPDSLDNLASCFLNERKTEIHDYSKLHLDAQRYEYLRRDCVLLYGVLSRYFTLLYDKLGGKAGISSASTALATYRTNYQRHILPDISEKAASLARAGYYGGRCEPFRREFKGPGILHCYDVNSLYPWAMRQHMPVEEIHVKGYHPELCGFVDATVSVRNVRVPILPCRAEKRLLFPTGKWRGVFSTAELRMAEKHKQLSSLSFHRAVYFNTAPIFVDFVDRLYIFRDKSKKDWDLSLDRVAKISMNSLYGKFGSQEARETIHIRPTFDDMVDRQMQQMPSPLTNIECFIERTEVHTDYMLPQISAWVTALGRCRLVEGLLEEKIDPYYCDTDSIYTEAVLQTGSGLGEWKDEYAYDPIVYAYFLAPKVYVLRHNSGKVTNKAKGFSKFGEKLPPDAIAILASGKSLEVSRFAKARSVIAGDFGLMVSQKKCHLQYEKRIFHKDGSSDPRRVSL